MTEGRAGGAGVREYCDRDVLAWGLSSDGILTEGEQACGFGEEGNPHGGEDGERVGTRETKGRGSCS